MPPMLPRTNNRSTAEKKKKVSKKVEKRARACTSTGRLRSSVRVSSRGYLHANRDASYMDRRPWDILHSVVLPGLIRRRLLTFTARDRLQSVSRCEDRTRVLAHDSFVRVKYAQVIVRNDLKTIRSPIRKKTAIRLYRDLQSILRCNTRTRRERERDRRMSYVTGIIRNASSCVWTVSR